MGGYKGDETTGFQSPAQDFIEEPINLAEVLDLQKPGLYVVRVTGDGLTERGIGHGDLLVVNAAANPFPGKVCVAMTNGEVILAVLKHRDGLWYLQSPLRNAIQVSDDVDVWGIVEVLVRKPV